MRSRQGPPSVALDFNPGRRGSGRLRSGANYGTEKSGRLDTLRPGDGALPFVGDDGLALGGGVPAHIFHFAAGIQPGLGRFGLRFALLPPDRHAHRVAVQDLEACLKQWPDEIKSIITETLPYHDYQKAFDHHSVDEIKVVVEWGE